MTTLQTELIEINQILKTVSHIDVRDMSKTMFKFLRSKTRRYLKICDALCSMSAWNENHHGYVKRFNFSRSLGDPRSAKLTYRILDVQSRKTIDESYLLLQGY